jgi:hypothetical protein
MAAVLMLWYITILPLYMAALLMVWYIYCLTSIYCSCTDDVVHYDFTVRYSSRTDVWYI